MTIRTASEARRGVRYACAAALVCAAGLMAASPAGAQPHGRRVALRIAPRVGDTIQTRLEQSMDLDGTSRVGAVDSTLHVHSELVLHSRIIVEASGAGGTTVLTHTDSATARSHGGRSASTSQALRAAFVGKQVRLRISPQGSATVLAAPQGLRPDVASIISQMPAMLPTEPKAVGESWANAMTIPIAGQDDAGGATLETTYRLDSLSRDERVAFISMRGRLTRDSTAGRLPSGALLSSKGTLSGSLVVDRARGWWKDARTTIHVRSVVTPPPGGQAAPATLQLTITQRLRTDVRP